MTTRTKTDELALVARVRFLLKIVGDQFFGVDQHLGNRRLPSQGMKCHVSISKGEGMFKGRRNANDLVKKMSATL
jgi:hypothetical protein